MNTNKLVDEDYVRSKQLQEMKKLEDFLSEKISVLKMEKVYLEKQISNREEIYETKIGKLNYIREEKEAVFNKFQNYLNENRNLKRLFVKTESNNSKKNQGNILQNILNYFKDDSFDTIDVSNGKVSKNLEKSDLKPKMKSSEKKIKDYM